MDLSYPKLTLQGWLFADKGYLGKEFWEKLKAQSIELFAKVKKNMKEKIITPIQRFYLSKRGLIEIDNDQLKNICQIEYTRHRKPANAFVNLISGLIAYTFKPRNLPSKTINYLSQNPFLRLTEVIAICTLVMTYGKFC